MKLHCKVVTPEKTEVDRLADSVILPMVDGSLGVLRGRAPMIGRLGHGILKLTKAGVEHRYFVEGGFAQVEDDTISIVTQRSVPLESLDVTASETGLNEALAMPASSPAQNQLKTDAVARARGQLRAARSAR